jgi:hypothetical protein
VQGLVLPQGIQGLAHTCTQHRAGAEDRQVRGACGLSGEAVLAALCGQAAGTSWQAVLAGRCLACKHGRQGPESLLSQRHWPLRPRLPTLCRCCRFERGSFFLFDPSSWEVVRKDSFVVHFEHLERAPNLTARAAGTAAAPGAAGGAAPAPTGAAAPPAPMGAPPAK